MRNEHLKMLVVSALFAAIIGIAAQIVIKIPPVPFTGQSLAIMFTATILGKRYGTIATLLYVLMGLIGIPVFHGMQSGIGMILGPTGGFILGFIPAAFLIGYLIEKLGHKTINAIIANVIGAMVILIFGSIWLKIVTELSWPAAFQGGMLPFIIPDTLKAIVSAILGITIYNRLISARLMPNKA